MEQMTRVCVLDVLYYVGRSAVVLGELELSEDILSVALHYEQRCQRQLEISRELNCLFERAQMH